ncbi:MAG TPA: PsiF family protein [Pseudolabrys sp.]|nr:PsiF family protein [Pseudolabrys sp.]
MRRTMIAMSLTTMSLFPLLLATPASAATNEQKMETCKFGADDAKLDGAKRKAFMTKCMSNRDDKRGPAAKPAEKKG